MNLALNARDAMPHGGRITISTSCGTFASTGKPASMLSVEDTGCGMDAATRARIFEPFFTTKQPGQGTGLGLATIRRIVDETHGIIEVQSEPGRGTRIEVVFPAVADLTLVESPSAGLRTGETILLVDDHDGARRSLHHTLRNAGYCVHPASSGERALKIFSEHAANIDLLVADCRMPGMDGIELVEQLRRSKPRLKALLISGYRPAQERPEPISVPLIHKPFSGTEIIQRVRSVLDSNGELPC
jgi:CheY-like chemotaxis protein